MSKLDHTLIEKITKARATNPPKVHSPIPEKQPISLDELNASGPATAVEKAKPAYWWHGQMNKSGR
jgi:hypothetical protein